MYFKHEGILYPAFLHVSDVFKSLGTYLKHQAYLDTAFLNISLVFRLKGTDLKHWAFIIFIRSTTSN